MRRLLTFVLGIGLLACASYAAWATFPGSPGSIQYRNPPYLRAFVPEPIVCIGSSCQIDWRQGPWFTLTLTSNVTFPPPANVGSNCIQIDLIQDSVGSRTATWTNTTNGTGWKFAGGTSTTLTTTAGAQDTATACPYRGGQPSAAQINIGLNYK
jgi:hypothetical protein